MTSKSKTTKTRGISLKKKRGKKAKKKQELRIAHVKRSFNVCNKCGKKIKGWGMDGCPTVSKGSEMGVLFGMCNGWIHYKCMENCG